MLIAVIHYDKNNQNIEFMVKIIFTRIIYKIVRLM